MTATLANNQYGKSNWNGSSKNKLNCAVNVNAMVTPIAVPHKKDDKTRHNAS